MGEIMAGRIGILVCALGMAWGASAGDETVIPNGQSGIAAKYPGDKGIEKDPAVVVHEPFEGQKEFKDFLKGVWTDVRNKGGRCMEFSESVPEASPGKRSLAIKANRGHDEGGMLFASLKKGYDTLFARVYVRFAEDSNYLHHAFIASLSARINPKPWPQGGAGTRPRGDQWFGMNLEPSAKGPNGTYAPPPGSWHFYGYWHQMQSKWGTTFGPGKLTPVKRGEWICTETMIRANSAPDKKDGALACWIDGELLGWWGPEGVKGKWKDRWVRNGRSGEEFSGFSWRTTDRLKLNQLSLGVYMSGSDRAAQKTERRLAKFPDIKANRQVQAIYFDDLVVATKYIGPVFKEKPGTEAATGPGLK